MVRIYLKGDRYWFVFDYGDYEMGTDTARKYSMPVNKLFSTLDKAKEYVKRKKILFSLDDIMEVIRTVKDGTYGYDNRSYLSEKFNELAKQKVNQ